MVVALYVDGMTDAQATQSPHSDAALIYGKVCVCVCIQYAYHYVFSVPCSFVYLGYIFTFEN